MKNEFTVFVGCKLQYNDGTDNTYTVVKLTANSATFNTGAVYPLRKISDWLHSGRLKIV